MTLWTLTSVINDTRIHWPFSLTGADHEPEIVRTMQKQNEANYKLQRTQQQGLMYIIIFLLYFSYSICQRTWQLRFSHIVPGKCLISTFSDVTNLLYSVQGSPPNRGTSSSCPVRDCDFPMMSWDWWRHCRDTRTSRGWGTSNLVKKVETPI